MSELIGLGPMVGGEGPRMLLARLVLDLAFAGVVIRIVYFRLYRNREHVFTCSMLNVVTLCLCLLLRKGPTELGLGLALFGVFGILRYRTEQIRSRDLTYLFVAIGLGMINGVADRNVSVAELLAFNGVIAILTVLLERYGATEGSTPMLYDRLKLLQPGQEASLIADIAYRTGLAVVRVEIQRIDLLRDAAEIMIYFRPPADQGHSERDTSKGASATA